MKLMKCHELKGTGTESMAWLSFLGSVRTWRPPNIELSSAADQDQHSRVLTGQSSQFRTTSKATAPTICYVPLVYPVARRLDFASVIFPSSSVLGRSILGCCAAAVRAISRFKNSISVSRPFLISCNVEMSWPSEPLLI